MRSLSSLIVGGGVVAMTSVAAFGCTGSTVPWTFEGEPVCADFKVGAQTDMSRGGLKKPLRATFNKGGDVVARVVIYGLRQKGDAATPLLLPDADEEYDVEWAECENERAPVIVSKNKPFDTRYECGEAKPYTTVKVQTKSGETNRKIPVTAPPAAPCWEAEQAGTGASAAPSAAPPPAAEPPPAASAQPAASAVPSASASAAPAASASANAPPAKP